MSQFRSLLKAESGSGLVEYAIVFILMMTMLLGIADFSRALYALSLRFERGSGSDSICQREGCKLREHDPDRVCMPGGVVRC